MRFSGAVLLLSLVPLLVTAWSARVGTQAPHLEGLCFHTTSVNQGLYNLEFAMDVTSQGE
jgi:hypothetical protein